MTNIVARDVQLASLASILNQALDGRLQIVFLTGEAGVGKTALLGAFVEQTRKQNPDISIAGSRCQAVTGSTTSPFQPFEQILASLLTESSNPTVQNRVIRILNDVAPDWLGAIPVVGGVIAAVVRTAQSAWRELRVGEAAENSQLRLVQFEAQ